MNGSLVVLLALLSPTSGVESQSVSQAATTKTDTRVTKTHHTPWDNWSLSEAQWRRYQVLRSGVRGAVSDPNITPIEVLGIHARTDRERRQYAELWAKLMFEDAERILAFEQAYQKAIRRLYPGVPMVDRSRLPARSVRTESPTTDDRYLFFTRLDCDACELWWSRLVSEWPRNAKIDIFVDGVENAEQLKRWAAQHRLDAGQFRSGSVSLNRLSDELSSIAGPRAEPPVLFRERGGRLTRVVALTPNQ